MECTLAVLLGLGSAEVLPEMIVSSHPKNSEIPKNASQEGFLAIL